MIVTCKLHKTEATQQSVFHFLLNKIDFSFDESINLKSGSRGAARAAKSLRWRV